MTAPGDYPAPDSKDSSGRLRRIVLSLLIAAAAGAAGYFIANALAKPDEALATGHSTYHASKAYQFVGYIAGLAFIVAFLVAMAVQKKLADRAYVKGLSPQVRVHKS